MIQINFRKQKGEDEARFEDVNVEEFIAVKGLKAKGNTLTKDSVNTIDALDSIPFEPSTPEATPPEDDDAKEDEEAADSDETTTVELDVEPTPKSEPKAEKPKDSPADPDDEGQLGLF